MKTHLTLFLLALLFTAKGAPQDSLGYEDYAKQVFDMLLDDDEELCREFVDLTDYIDYVNSLDISDKKKDELKVGAARNYDPLRRSFRKECRRFRKLYAKEQKQGAEFAYDFARFNADEEFPGTGFIVCHYRVKFDEKYETDSFRFEVVKTKNGWKILDGFFEEFE